MKRLLLMRHAKSDWTSGAAHDHDRPLNGRGHAAAQRMGRLLTEIDQQPELVVTSSAVRARRTAELAALAGEWSADIVVERSLYGASPSEVIAIMGSVPDEIGRLMLVGHQPTWGGVVHSLTGAATQMKTATVAIVDLMLGASWASVEPPVGELVALLQPRHFATTDPRGDG